MKTTRNTKFDHTALTAAITERISLLEEIAVAVTFAFTSALPAGWITSPAEEPTLAERRSNASQQRPKGNRTAKPSKRKAVKQRNGKNKNLILEVLAAGPLSSAEVYNRMKAKGWQTSSDNPRSLVGVTLGGMAKRGQVRKVGGDWELPTPAATTTVADMTTEMITI